MIEYLNPLAWGRWLGQFTSTWIVSRPWREIPKAIPAVIVMVVLGATTIAAWSGASDWRGRLLTKQAQAAWDADDFDTVELVLRRRINQSPNDSDLVHELALAKDSQGNRDEALELMRGLVSSKNHEHSARWLLKTEYIGKAWDDLSSEQQDEFGKILGLIHAETPDDMGIKQLFADYLVASGNYAKAIPLLDELSRIQPMRGLQAAALSRKIGNDSTADRLANRTLDTISKMLDEEPANSVLALAITQNQLFLKRHGEAVRTLDEAIKNVKTDEERQRLSLAMGDAIAAWVNQIEEAPATTTKERVRVLKMLQVALRYAPNNPRVLTLVADQSLATLNDDDEQVKAIREALVNGSSTGIAHFIRGTAALMNNDIEAANRSLTLANREMPLSGAVLNNLAVAMTMRDEPDFEQALKISESAIEQTPDPTAHFFETRGQILFRLERYLDAIPDLEKALSVPALAPKAHESLAVCYEKIDEPELSKLHREAIDTKKRK